MLCGKYLVGSKLDFREVDYGVIGSVSDYKNSSCIIVKTLNPDYYLLFGSVKLVITESGSALSHLSIVAREQGIPVFLLDKPLREIKKNGKLSISDNCVKVI